MEPIFDFFFGQPVPAVKARKLGFALLIHAIERGVKLTFKSYERLFPNQDYLPESGLGEPSCFAFAGGQARKLDNSVFVKKSRSRKKFPAGRSAVRLTLTVILEAELSVRCQSGWST